jgi:alpha-galactosidase
MKKVFLFIVTVLFIAFVLYAVNNPANEDKKVAVGFDYNITKTETMPYAKDVITLYVIANTGIFNKDGLLNLSAELFKNYPEHDRYNQFRVEIQAQSADGHWVKTNFTQFSLYRSNSIAVLDHQLLENELKDKYGNIWRETYLGMVKD